MSMNRYMHPRNRYRREKPDFAQLARDNPSFAAACQLDERGRVVVNFKLPHQLAALTKALLQRDFQLQVELPLDRLIPTLPLRLNYLHWLEDILGVGGSESDDAGRIIHGIDIGTGSCCVYPLLAARCHPNWHFLATEVDKRNAAYAEENVARNGLRDRIRVALAPSDAGPLDFPLTLADSAEQFDFCMCNPPFFSDAAEAQGLLNTRSDSRHPPMSASTAASVESFSSGGEVMFVSRMAQESSRHRGRCRIFTSMLGRKPSLKPLKRLLERLGVASYGTYEFCQGRVMRWGIGWTFQAGVSFPMSEFKRRKLQSRPPLTMQLPQRSSGESDQPDADYNLDAVYGWCKKMLKRHLRVDCWDQLNKQGATGRRMRISAKEVTWTRQRHRRRHPSASGRVGEAANRSQASELSGGESEGNRGVTSAGACGNCRSVNKVQDDVTTGKSSDDVIGDQGDKGHNDVSKGQRDPDVITGQAGNQGLNDVITGQGDNKGHSDDNLTPQSDCLPPPDKRPRLDSPDPPAADAADRGPPGHRSPRKQAASTSPSKQPTQSKEPPVLVANLSMDYNDAGVIELQLGWLDGSGRELMQQLLLCLRNLYTSGAVAHSDKDEEEEGEAAAKAQ